MHHRLRLLLSVVALAALTPAAAQVASTVTITSRTAPFSIGGFADVPVARSPLQATAYGREALADAGAASLADLTRLDASLADAYNAEGYWSYLTVRGFVLDNRANYRRDGLPISAETFLSLANKERIEVLKGTSGIQAGTSAPGGLVNLVVKRPTGRTRHAALRWQQDATLTGAVDLGDRFGADGRFGLRVNAQAARLEPRARAADGSSRLFALAGDLRLSSDSLLEVEIENSQRSQPSVPGFSLLANHVPDARSIDPRTNLNNQPWSLPVVLDGNTASLRWRQRLATDWHFTAHAGTQRLSSDDRVAFPFGCYDAGPDVYWADRYCPDGSVDLYDFRSLGERRRIDALDLRIEGSASVAGVTHRISAGLLGSRVKDRFNRQAFNFANTGNVRADVIVPAAPDLTDENTNRDERSTELYLRDAIALSADWQVWAGLRHSRLDRRSVRTDGSRATAYEQSFSTPWLALAWQANAQTLAYLSAGRGVESEVVPNRSRYGNRGEPLPALKSRQVEAGIKYDSERLDGSLVAFDIHRPMAQDRCDDGEPVVCTRTADDLARHRGVEASAALRAGAWGLQGSALWLRARLANSSLRPTNVPAQALRLRVTRDIDALPGLQLQASVAHEGSRAAVPDNSLSIPAWTRLDLGARYRQSVDSAVLTWRIGVDNVTDRRAWRESPYQFGHAYLFPMAPRTWRASVQADL